MKKTFTEFWSLLKDTYRNWNNREPFNNSIIIAYYTIFSLPGLLVILITIAGFAFGKEAVTGQISKQIQGMVGGNTAKDIESMVATSSKSNGSILATIISVATLLFGATGVFYQFQQILNKVWEVKPSPKQAFLKLIRDRVFSFGLILGIAFLLIVSLALSAGLSGLSDWVNLHLSKSLLWAFGLVDIAFSLGVITFLFAAMFKYLPDAKIGWKDVWMGGLLTGVLFTFAKFALGLYFGKSNPASAYGAAGTIILIMLWVSYSGMIVLFGAEFTQVYVNRHGKKAPPTEGAESTSNNSKDPLSTDHNKEEELAKGSPEMVPNKTSKRVSDTGTVLQGLQTLAGIHLDRVKGYALAAKEVEVEGAKSLFEKCAQDSGVFISELEAKIIGMGGSPVSSSTAGGLFRMWMSLQAKVTGHSLSFLLDTCEEGENVAIEAYKQTIQEISFSEELQQLISKQEAKLKESKEAIQKIRNQVEATS